MIYLLSIFLIVVSLVVGDIAISNTRDALRESGINNRKALCEPSEVPRDNA